ncbi:MAG: transposase [Planctomycetes bacterium]|nr:transposase [Planctomycetota bacterium]
MILPTEKIIHPDCARQNREWLHYFFRAASWLQNELFAYWSRYLVGRLCADQKTLLLAIDDTTHKKTGRKVDGARVCRDAVRSTTTKTVFCWALQYIPLCLVFHPPWGGEPLAIPLNIRLNRKNQQNVTLLEHAVDMLQELAVWLPDYDFLLVADGAFASLAGRLPPRVTLVSRLRADAALYELPPPQKPGQRGRPRQKGARLPKPSELAKGIPPLEWKLAQTIERGKIRERLVYARQAIWARVSKKPLLFIISRDPEGKEADDFFFSTDVTASPVLSVSDFADRWSVEDTFRNVKQYLGAEQPQSWKGIAPERAGAFPYLVYGAVWLARIERKGENTAVIQRKWYQEKDCVSFLDALADARQQLWHERIISMSSSHCDQTIIQKLLVNALVWAA